GSTFLTSEQIETIRALKGKVPKYKIIRDFHINENRVNDIWENCERQQQIIHLEETKSRVKNSSTTLPNKEIKKKSSKSILYNNKLRSHISDSISTNNSNIVASTLSKTEKISSENLGILYEKEARRDEKNKVNMKRLLAT
ncbi:37665_t:CDS:1, partial [Gigaspora margarita]